MNICQQKWQKLPTRLSLAVGMSRIAFLIPLRVPFRVSGKERSAQRLVVWAVPFFKSFHRKKRRSSSSPWTTWSRRSMRNWRSHRGKTRTKNWHENWQCVRNMLNIINILDVIAPRYFWKNLSPLTGVHVLKAGWMGKNSKTLTMPFDLYYSGK